MDNNEKPKGEKSQALLVSYPTRFDAATFTTDTTILDGLKVSKVFRTRVAQGREQFKQNVIFDFRGCTLMTLLESAITSLGIDYQQSCRGDEKFWGMLENKLRNNPEVTVEVAKGFSSTIGGLNIIQTLDDSALSSVIAAEAKRRGKTVEEIIALAQQPPSAWLFSHNISLYTKGLNLTKVEAFFISLPSMLYACSPPCLPPVFPLIHLSHFSRISI